MSSSLPFSAERIRHDWEAALRVWDVTTTLSPPQAYESGRGKSHWQGDEPLAYIDLVTRQVVVNFELLQRMGAASSLTAVLAHEIGHHVRFPHTLGLAATLQVLERRLIPGLQQSLTNLFFDLQVNQHVGRTLSEELIAVYNGFLKTSGEQDLSPLFGFYLAVYEELWSREPGALLPVKLRQRLEHDYPGFAADARTFVQTFYDLPSAIQQFLYFCSRFLRYVPDPSKLRYVIPMASDVPDPDLDDFDAVVRGLGEGEVEDALREAREKGWIEDSGLMDRPEEDALTVIERVGQHLPGKGQGEVKQALVSKHYKRLVDQHLIVLPGDTPTPEPFLPTVPEEWEYGDNPRAIDWTQSVLQQGALAGVKPLKRDLEPDEPPPLAQDFPAVEIYLDTSGSMPNPAAALNAMTLAAQILAASALRKKGIVRGIVYSSGSPLVSPWMYDEETARRFLLHYYGGGTDYPFALLKKFAKERGDVLRVVISDSDFLWNVRTPGAMPALQYGVEHSRVFVAFLSCAAAAARDALEPVLEHKHFRLALVENLAEFAQAAARLADALMPAPKR